MDPRDPIEPALQEWSTAHAIAIAVATLAAAAGLPPWILSACGALSFAALLYRGRGRWTPPGRFGIANGVTFTRIAGVVLLPWAAPAHIAAWAVLLFATDALDGWIARRTAMAGAFGELADKESDAFLMLMLCVLLHRLPAGFAAWILLPGMLRYGFVLFLACAKPPRARERRTATAGWISIAMMVTLIACFVGYPDHVGELSVLAMAASAVLCYSFAVSLHDLYATDRQREMS